MQSHPASLASVFAVPIPFGFHYSCGSNSNTLGFTIPLQVQQGEHGLLAVLQLVSARMLQPIPLTSVQERPARAIHIGDSTQANLVTVGSATGAAALTVESRYRETSLLLSSNSFNSSDDVCSKHNWRYHDRRFSSINGRYNN